MEGQRNAASDLYAIHILYRLLMLEDKASCALAATVSKVKLHALPPFAARVQHVQYMLYLCKDTRGEYLEAIRRLLQKARAENQRGKPNVPDLLQLSFQRQESHSNRGPGICTDPWPPRSSHRAYLDHSRLAVILSESWTWPTGKSKWKITSDATLDRSPGQCMLLIWHFPSLKSGSVSCCVTRMGAGTFEATHTTPLKRKGWGGDDC